MESGHLGTPRRESASTRLNGIDVRYPATAGPPRRDAAMTVLRGTVCVRWTRQPRESPGRIQLCRDLTLDFVPDATARVWKGVFCSRHDNNHVV